MESWLTFELYMGTLLRISAEVLQAVLPVKEPMFSTGHNRLGDPFGIRLQVSDSQ